MEKGLYTGGPEGAQSWTQEALDGIMPGLLDTIYAENPEYAKAAYAALKNADRNDSVEVICAGLDPQIIGDMIENHWLMGRRRGLQRVCGRRAGCGYGAGACAKRQRVKAGFCAPGGVF